ncbi:hypothetical protein IRY61_06565 [Candidatus Saccharibacteria bacterium]|nr:hypothetical protein [Candidatus Saccharibacteria bacterium]
MKSTKKSTAFVKFVFINAERVKQRLTGFLQGTASRWFGVLVLLSSINRLDAGLMYAWSYQEMFDKANFVVIASPVWNKDTDERSQMPGVGDIVPLVGVNTEFRVRAVLKGDRHLRDFILHHYRLAQPEVAIIDGPVLVDFDVKHPRAYLMFLIKEPDGRFGPVTDQMDLGAFSIIKLESSAQ